MNRKKIRKKIIKNIKTRLKNKVKREGTTITPGTTKTPICTQWTQLGKELIQKSWDLNSKIGESKAAIADSQQGLLEFAFNNNSAKFMEIKKQLDDFVKKSNVAFENYINNPQNGINKKIGISTEDVNNFVQSFFNTNDPKTGKFLNNIREEACKGRSNCLDAMDSYLNSYIEESITKRISLISLDSNVQRRSQIKEKIANKC